MRLIEFCSGMVLAFLSLYFHRQPDFACHMQKPEWVMFVTENILAFVCMCHMFFSANTNVFLFNLNMCTLLMKLLIFFVVVYHVLPKVDPNYDCSPMIMIMHICQQVLIQCLYVLETPEFSLVIPAAFAAYIVTHEVYFVGNVENVYKGHLYAVCLCYVLQVLDWFKDMVYTYYHQSMHSKKCK